MADEFSAVETFIKDFIHKENQARRAKYLEPSATDALAKIHEANAAYENPIVSTGITRTSDLSPDEIKKYAATGNGYKPRSLFRISAYTHPKYGTLYYCIVGASTPDTPTAYAEAFVVGRTTAAISIEGDKLKGSHLRILAQYRLCDDCNGAGCGQCGDTGWTHKLGLKISAPGKPAGNRLIERPGNATHQADWDSRKS